MLKTNLWSFINRQIWGPSKISALNFSVLNAWNTPKRYLKQSLSLFKALTNCFIIPSFICRGGSKTCWGFTKSSSKIFFSPIKNFFLVGQFFRVQYSWRARLSQRHRKQGYLVNPLCCPSNMHITFKSPHIIRLCSQYMSFRRTSAVVS